MVKVKTGTKKNRADIITIFSCWAVWLDLIVYLFDLGIEVLIVEVVIEVSFCLTT